MATAEPAPQRIQLQPGQQPTQEQIQQMQQQFFAEAARRGLTPQQFGEQLKAQALAQQQQAQDAQGQGQGGQQGQQQQQQQQHQQHQHQQQQQGGQQVPIQPGPPKPEAIELAKFLKSQDLKSRVCILQEKRRDMFKVKRAIRAIQSPAYEKARSKKNSQLPPVTDRASAEQVFKLLPMSMLAIRVSKLDANNNPGHGEPGHQHGLKPTKGKKGLWTVKLEQQQDADDHLHYVWFYEGAQWRQKLYAAGALLAVVAVVLFPLWPYTLRRGVWYLSMGCLGLLGAFFGLAIVRLILFVISLAALPPGIWLYPNLFEDVGFFDSFRPLWAWRETKETLDAKKAAKKEKKRARRIKAAAKSAKDDHVCEVHGHHHDHDHDHDHDHHDHSQTNGKQKKNKKSAAADVPIVPKAGATGSAANDGAADGSSTLTERRNMQARVEEVDE